jgi:hypothetical protein
MDLQEDYEPAPPAAMAPEDVIRARVPTWDDPVFPQDEPAPDIILGELLLMYFEWMGSHKVTDACAKAAYTLLSTLMPKMHLHRRRQKAGGSANQEFGGAPELDQTLNGHAPAPACLYIYVRTLTFMYK